MISSGISDMPSFDIPVFSDKRYRSLQATASYPNKTVWRAFDTQSQKYVGMSVFPLAVQDAAQAWTLAAISSLRKNESPFLATITDINTTEKGQPYFCYDVGELPFLRLCTPVRMRETAMFISIATQLLQALHTIHSSGHIFGPLHPDSISAPSSHALDIHIHYDAWLPTMTMQNTLHSSITQGLYTHRLSPALRMYAPEYFTGAMPDARADLYALGICLFEALAGEKSFHGTPEEYLRTADTHTADRIQKFAPRFPDALADWLHVLIAPQRAHRFPQAYHALTALSDLGFSSIPEIKALRPTALFSLHSSIPIGRERVLNAMKHSRHEAGAPRLLEISGEPGTGKSLLLERIRCDIHRTGKKALLVKGSIFHSTEKPIPSFSDTDVLLIDDIEKAKPEGNSTLKYIMARNPDVILVATHRTQLPFAVRRDDVQMIAHWTEQNTRQYCTDILGIGNYDVLAKALHKRSAGNPYMVILLLHDLMQQEIIRYEKNEWSVLNLDAFMSMSTAFPQMYVRDRIAALPADERDLLLLLFISSVALPAYIPTETLNLSGRAVIRIALSLAYKGLITLQQYTIEIAHEFVRDAIQLLANTEYRTRAEDIATAFKRSIEALANNLQTDNPMSDNFTSQDIENAPAISEHHADIDDVRDVFEIIENDGQWVGDMQESTIMSAQSDPIPSPHPIEILDHQAYIVGDVLILGDVDEPDTKPSQISVTVQDPQQTETQKNTLVPTTNSVQHNVVQHEEVSPRDTLMANGILVGTSDAVTKLRANIQRFAPLDIPVILIGALGTKKDIVAHSLHQHSRHHVLPFISFVCSDYTTEELDAELFASDTGIFSPHKAHTVGTVFLDDITALDTLLQSKIARIIRRSYNTETSLSSGCRFILGSALSPEDAVSGGKLLQELYYTASSARILIPTLSERGTDIPALATMYVHRLNSHLNTHFTGFTARAHQLLMQRSWQGNLLELEHIVRKAMLETSDTSGLIGHHVLQGSSSHTPSAVSLPIVTPQAVQQPLFISQIQAGTLSVDAEGSGIATIDDMQKEHILRVLEQTNHNKSEASKILGIKRTTLIARMKKLGLMP